VLLACLLFSLIMPWLPVPKVDRSKEEELPPRLAKLLLERESAAPAVVRKTGTRSGGEAPARSCEAPARSCEARAEEAAGCRSAQARARQGAGGTAGAARRRASGVGLLAMKDELADLRGAPGLLRSSKKTSSRGPASGPVPDRAWAPARARGFRRAP